MLFQNIMERLAKRDFIFIDETGDPGKDLHGGSSPYFAIGAVHVTDISLEKLHRHLFAMGYFSGRFRELKSSRLSRLQKDQIEDIAKWLYASDDVGVTVVFVDKYHYTGPYFSQEGERSYDPIRFRNFLTRLLLEQHVAIRPMMSTECDLIFDRAIAESEEENLRRYLRGNFRLPVFTNILQCDSRYVLALQFTDAIVHIVKEYLFGQRESVDGRMLNSINVFNVTNPSDLSRIALP